jgi:opacity protein-like surface antigen
MLHLKSSGKRDFFWSSGRLSSGASWCLLMASVQLIGMTVPWRRSDGVGWLLSMAALLALAPVTAFSQAWTITPQVGVAQGYDDNLRLSRLVSSKVFTTTVPVGVEALRETERLRFLARARYDFINYWGDDASSLKDRDNQLLEVDSRYKTELTRFRLNAGYLRDTLLRTAQENIGSGAPGDIDVDLVPVNLRRNRLIINPAWDRNLTARAGVGLNYRFNDTTHDEQQGISLVDFNNHLIFGDFFYDLSERSRASLDLGAQIYRGEGGRDFESYALLAGLDHRLTETIEVGGAAGIRFTSFDTPVSDGDDTGFVGNLYGEGVASWGRFEGIFERRLRPSSSGELLDTRQLSLRFERDLLAELELRLRGRLFRTTSLDSNERDRDYFAIEPGVSWQLTQTVSLGAFYSYRWQKRDDEDDSVDSNAFFVALRYEQPRTLPFKF